MSYFIKRFQFISLLSGVEVNWRPTIKYSICSYIRPSETVVRVSNISNIFNISNIYN